MSTNTLGNYLAIQKVLDAAIAAGGATYALPTKGAAIHWRQRAYKFRQLAQKKSITGSSPYDSLFLRIRDDEPNVVRIEFEELKGELRGPDGKPIVIAEQPQTAPPHDDYEEQARQLARDLDIEI